MKKLAVPLNALEDRAALLIVTIFAHVFALIRPPSFRQACPRPFLVTLSIAQSKGRCHLPRLNDSQFSVIIQLGRSPLALLVRGHHPLNPPLPDHAAYHLVSVLDDRLELLVPARVEHHQDAPLPRPRPRRR